MFRFDPTINIGTLFTVIAGAVVALRMYTGITARLDRLEARMDPVWQWFTTELKEMHVTSVAVERKLR